MSPHPLTNFEIHKYYQNEPKFNGVYSRSNLSAIKNRAYITNFDEYESTWTHWIVLFVNAENITYFGSFGVEHIPKEIRNFTGNKKITTNISRIQAYNSVMGWYFCIGFIDFMLKTKSLLEYINLISPVEYERKDKMIVNIFNRSEIS